jgi:hypothetical protein
MKRDTHLNVIGPEVRRIRKQRGWSQSKLALHLQSVGWNISRSGLAKIECRIMWVGDFELLRLVAALLPQLRQHFVKLRDHRHRAHFAVLRGGFWIAVDLNFVFGEVHICPRDESGLPDPRAGIRKKPHEIGAVF